MSNLKPKGHFCFAKVKYGGMERLFKRIFYDNNYNEIVRPVDNQSITYVETELKVLQIDLVIR
jgi:hypothetical protein